MQYIIYLKVKIESFNLNACIYGHIYLYMSRSIEVWIAQKCRKITFFRNSISTQSTQVFAEKPNQVPLLSTLDAHTRCFVNPNVKYSLFMAFIGFTIFV